MVKRIQYFFRRVFIFPIRVYQKLISPILPSNTCLYHPSCSRYTVQSILKHGIFKGFVLGATRIFRCNGAFFLGGDDPVPERFTFKYIGESYRKFSRRQARKRRRERDANNQDIE